MRTRTLVLIVAGAVVVLSGITVAIVGGGQLFASAISSVTTGPPLIDRAAGEPVAAEPLECAAQCFAEAAVGTALSSQRDFRLLGLTEPVDRWGDFESTNAAIEYSFSADEWRRSDFEPEECFFTYLGTPIAAEFGERPELAESDTIQFGATQTDEYESTYLWQSVRFFESSQAAEDHMRALDGLTGECTGFSSPDFPRSTVSPAPSLELPGSVAAIGWVEATTTDRYYVYDVQRGNVVVRSILSTWGDDVSQQDFDDFVESLASSLAKIDVVVEESTV